ncbi:hypothetical protein KJ865_09710, partial [Myxococcota bacterium]|nr:hypothetical protein [Myxococcota bacterium]
NHIATYNTQYTDYTKRSSRLSQVVSRESVYHIADKFQKIVMEADLGIVDVSWSRRSNTRIKWARLNDRKAKITIELESRFGEVQDTKVAIDKDKYRDPFEKPVKKKTPPASPPKKGKGGVK